MEKQFKYVFGPIPSRRLGRSLGISPIPKKTCNYSCIYCQLGRTDKMTNERHEFFELQDIVDEFKAYLCDEDKFDIVTIVGDGEPTLYSRLGDLTDEIHCLTDKPVAVITNGALMYEKAVRDELSKADFVLPSLDYCDKETYKKIDRPFGQLDFESSFEGLVKFTNEYKGKTYMEIMLIDGINDDETSIEKFKEELSRLKYDKLYINTPVRPPAESYAGISSKESIETACRVLGGISIDALTDGNFFSEISDDYDAIISIIGRHPMNQHEVQMFLESRGVSDFDKIDERLHNDSKVHVSEYKGYTNYRLA